MGRLRNKLYSPRLPRSVVVGVRKLDGEWRPPARRRASFSKDGIPRFLNKTGVLADSNDWDNPSVARLWRYNLHYFDDLNAENAEGRADVHRRLITRWIDENPPAIGTGWEPYPCSLRIVNLIKWALAGNELLPSWRVSIGIQSEWLSKNIEWHLLGNHLFSNGKALIFAGLYFQGQFASKWLSVGLAIVSRELKEQVLPDGGQFERSPMYHSIALDDVFDLINLAESYPGKVAEDRIASWRSTAEKMLFWLRVMQHPDNEIALFNDSALCVAPSPTQLELYASRLSLSARETEPGLTALRDSGYYRAETANAVLHVDIGAVGPDYLPGHAHADTLAFELSLFGDRWFVDSGCGTYENSGERLRQRGTAAHNTVIVDDEDSSEVWSSFRVARRARPLDAKAKVLDDAIVLSGSHDGYRRLKGKVTHSRVYSLEESSLQITDTLSGSHRSAEVNYLLHPDIAAEITGRGEQVRLCRGAKVVEIGFEGGRARVQNTTWHPEFGRDLTTRKLNIIMQGDRLVTTMSWHRG